MLNGSPLRNLSSPANTDLGHVRIRRTQTLILKLLELVPQFTRHWLVLRAVSSAATARNPRVSKSLHGRRLSRIDRQTDWLRGLAYGALKPHKPAERADHRCDQLIRGCKPQEVWVHSERIWPRPKWNSARPPAAIPAALCAAVRAAMLSHPLWG